MNGNMSGNEAEDLDPRELLAQADSDSQSLRRTASPGWYYVSMAITAAVLIAATPLIGTGSLWFYAIFFPVILLNVVREKVLVSRTGVRPPRPSTWRWWEWAYFLLGIALLTALVFLGLHWGETGRPYWWILPPAVIGAVVVACFGLVLDRRTR